jgi:predicted secreted protein
LAVPDIAENGAVVPLTASTTMAGVKQLLILVEKNPSVLIAAFNVTPAVEADIRRNNMADPMRIRAQAAGDKATVRVLMSHEMETGQRKDACRQD